MKKQLNFEIDGKSKYFKVDNRFKINKYFESIIFK